MRRPLLLSAVGLSLALSLAACKRKEATAPVAETPAVASASSAAAALPASAPAAATVQAAKPFDLASVPVTTASLPPFPYISMPTGTGSGEHNSVVDFERAYVLAGSEVRKVEGRISERFASLGPLKMSPLGIHRNYEQALKAMGAVRVDTVYPGDEEFIKRNGGDKEALFKKLRIMNLLKSDEADTPGFEQYLLRTPTTNIWIAFHLFDNDNNVCVEVIEEKALEQSVKPIAAAEMATALQKDGHIALYLNFDTDSHVIRPDSAGVVEQIVKLLHDDPALKLKVEGHTDTVGDAAHNKQLSLARAQAVVDAVAAQKIAATRLSAAGLGSDKPLAPNTTDDGRAKNRRVELVRI